MSDVQIISQKHDRKNFVFQKSLHLHLHNHQSHHLLRHHLHSQSYLHCQYLLEVVVDLVLQHHLQIAQEIVLFLQLEVEHLFQHQVEQEFLIGQQPHFQKTDICQMQSEELLQKFQQDLYEQQRLFLQQRMGLVHQHQS